MIATISSLYDQTIWTYLEGPPMITITLSVDIRQKPTKPWAPSLRCRLGPGEGPETPDFSIEARPQLRSVAGFDPGVTRHVI